ncbi:3-dehydroquinate dehydratase [Saccharicrinis carchari]|uniref:3-dehydroquinate dehydratase n=1 Tax=Saccharicrinis carchari TaxID=1168039 RepID=A0A521APW3_SACCC|nr:type II 3-dehydroquinate dehydratase [Saccharicrinis carchari]SMO36869.1 3-dehydroquinate dehydratase [Saccharicrinis carchari]
MKLLILNGPNLNLLGKREVDIYGHQTFESYFAQLQKNYPNVELHYFQSNSEGELIDKLHQVGFSYQGVIFNAGAYTHTSIALSDAIAAISSPVIEVHISNIYKRESYRHHSYLSPVCTGSIAGFGLYSYNLAIEAFQKKT